MREVSNPLGIDDITIGLEIDVVFENRMITTRGTVKDITGEGDARTVIIETVLGPVERSAQELGLIPDGVLVGNRTYPLNKAPVERRTVTIDDKEVEFDVPESSTWLSTEAAVKTGRTRMLHNSQGARLFQSSEMPEELPPNAARLLGF